MSQSSEQKLSSPKTSTVSTENQSTQPLQEQIDDLTLGKVQEQLEKVTKEIDYIEAKLCELLKTKQALKTEISQTKALHQINKNLKTDDNKSESDQSQKTSPLKNG
tara:strand:+ start:81 stop:398 length:318 start_codon:yes stop_codon:yes gene_type:complete